MDRENNEIKLQQVHKMEEPDVLSFNSNIKEVSSAVAKIDSDFNSSAFSFKGLLLNAKLKIEETKELLKQERERLQDVNILCNKYSDFGSIINISKEDTTGELSFNDGVLTAASIDTSPVSFNIENIDGNGIEGNSYVLLNESFLSETLDTSERKAINDSTETTAYEYQRITVSNSEEDMPTYFNKDSIEAECQITISSKENFNEIKIKTDRTDLMLNKIYTSADGLSYALSREYNVELNNSNNIYDEQSYVFKSGVVQFVPSKFVKILLSSNGYSNDSIAYVKTFIDSIKDDAKIEIIEPVKTAKRHLIKINDIDVNKARFKKGMIITRELITSPIGCISIFSNEYIQGGRIEDNVSYFLIVNGIEHLVVPINCHRNGKKIVRVSSQVYESEHVVYVKEKIKSTKLKIVIKNSNQDISPYISNIKILVGENK